MSYPEGRQMSNMDQKTHVLLSVILGLVLLACYLVLILANDELPFEALIILSIITVISFYSHSQYYRYDTIHSRAKIFLMINMFLMFCLLYFDESNFEQIFILTIIGDCILAMPISFSIPFVAITYTLYFPFTNYLFSLRPGWVYSYDFGSDLVVGGFSLILLYMVKHQIKRNAQYNELLTEKELAYSRLEEASIRLENMAVAEERNRITLALHNSIGHLLTTTMLTLQAEKSEMVADNKIDEKAFEAVEEHISSALVMLRQVVENSDDFLKSVPLKELVDALISQSSTNGRFTLGYNIKSIDDVPVELNSAIFNVILESITNAMKHSNGSSVYVEISGENQVEIKVQDDGDGIQCHKHGYGMNKVDEIVRSLGGSYKCSDNSGCLVEVSIPYQKGVT